MTARHVEGGNLALGDIMNPRRKEANGFVPAVALALCPPPESPDGLGLCLRVVVQKPSFPGRTRAATFAMTMPKPNCAKVIYMFVVL